LLFLRVFVDEIIFFMGDSIFAVAFRTPCDAPACVVGIFLTFDELGYGIQSWLGESGQRDKWIFCLTAARIAAYQERS
jgi:hypothetical protein